MAETETTATLRISIPKNWTPTYAEGKILKKQSCWRPPTYIGFQAPVPPPPDYSTPARVNARIAEFCGHPFTHKAAGDKSFGKLLKAFRAVVPRMVCPVADTHRPRWEYRISRAQYGDGCDVERRPMGQPKAAWTRVDLNDQGEAA